MRRIKPAKTGTRHDMVVHPSTNFKVFSFISSVCVVSVEGTITEFSADFPVRSTTGRWVGDATAVCMETGGSKGGSVGVSVGGSAGGSVGGELGICVGAGSSTGVSVDGGVESATGGSVTGTTGDCVGFGASRGGSLGGSVECATGGSVGGTGEGLMVCSVTATI